MILIMASGNPLREDDGAGLLMAHALQQHWQRQGIEVACIAVQQLVPELAAEIAGAEVDALYFVDARAAAGEGCHPMVTVERISARVAAVATASQAGSGHHLGPAVLLRYAELLSDRPAPPAWLVTVPGINFGHGQSLSHVAQSAIKNALDANPIGLVMEDSVLQTHSGLCNDAQHVRTQQQLRQGGAA